MMSFIYITLHLVKLKVWLHFTGKPVSNTNLNLYMLSNTSDWSITFEAVWKVNVRCKRTFTFTVHLLGEKLCFWKNTLKKISSNLCIKDMSQFTAVPLTDRLTSYSISTKYCTIYSAGQALFSNQYLFSNTLTISSRWHTRI